MTDSNQLWASSPISSPGGIGNIEQMLQGQFLVLEELVSLIVVSWQRSELTDSDAEECLMAAEEAIDEIERVVSDSDDGGIAVG